jgi:predicted methyltransferase
MLSGVEHEVSSVMSTVSSAITETAQQHLNNPKEQPMTRGKHQIIVGDCLEELKKLETGTVHACVTSPPYFRPSLILSSRPSRQTEGNR